MNERKKMEEPDTRKKTEAVAAEAQKEAREIAMKAKREADKLLALVSGPSSRKQPGESALGADGKIDYASCPDVKAPPGMKSVVTVVNNMWQVRFEQKD
jgi:hypothetical protein